MHFISIVADLEPPDSGAPAGLQEASYAHAAVMRLISAENPTAGRVLHDTQRNKHLTVALLQNAVGRPVLRLSFFGADAVMLAESAVAGLAKAQVLHLDRSEWGVAAIASSGSPWATTASWPDLVTSVHNTRFAFHFVTPTAFTKKDGKGRRVTGLLPDPYTLFTGLAWKWKSIDGYPLAAHLEQYLMAGGCAICSHELRTVTARLPERTQIGFIGKALYECLDKDPACIAALNQLTRLAFFTGCGYQVSRGMGAVMTETQKGPRPHGQ